MKAPTTSVLLTEENGLSSLKTYDLEVRAKNADSEGEWSKVSEYTGTNYNIMYCHLHLRFDVVYLLGLVAATSS